MNKYKYLTSLIIFFFATTLFSQNAAEYNKKGIEYFKQGEVKLAEHYFKLAIKVDPKFKDAHQNLGVLKYKNKEYFQAYHSFKIALYYLACDQNLRKHMKETTGVIIQILRSNLKKSTENLGFTGKIVSLPDPRLTNHIKKISDSLQNLNTCFICNGTGIIICNCEKHETSDDGRCTHCKNKKIFMCPICNGTGEWCPK